MAAMEYLGDIGIPHEIRQGMMPTIPKDIAVAMGVKHVDPCGYGRVGRGHGHLQKRDVPCTIAEVALQVDSDRAILTVVSHDRFPQLAQREGHVLIGGAKGRPIGILLD
jgi:hypothetical protein